MIIPSSNGSKGVGEATGKAKDKVWVGSSSSKESNFRGGTKVDDNLHVSSSPSSSSTGAIKVFVDSEIRGFVTCGVRLSHWLLLLLLGRVRVANAVKSIVVLLPFEPLMAIHELI